MQRLISSLICVGIFASVIIGSPLAERAAWPTLTSSCGVKNASRTLTCLQRYFGFFGIPAKHSLPRFETYEISVWDEFNAYGVRGLHQILDQYNSLVQCMDGNDMITCLSPSNFEYMFDMDEINARKYSADFAVSAFVSQNEKNATAYFPCLWDERTKFSSDLSTCKINIDVDINNGVNMCTAYTNFLKCSEKVYAPCGNDAKLFACTVEETAIQSYVNNYCMQNLLCNQ